MSVDAPEVALLAAPPALEFDGRVVWITGASKGLGRAMAFACCRAALPLLDASGDGAVVNISSVHGHRSYRRLLADAVSKGGLEMLTRVLADEWAERGIRVNSLAPGYIETEMTEGLRAHDGLSADILGRTPLGRFATPAEIAGCAMFLASPVAGYVTGTTLFADGGWSAR